jgi:ABC-type glucose/galactose transport system permease subunit
MHTAARYGSHGDVINKEGKPMPLIQLIVILVIVGVIMWVVNAYIPMQANIKNILNIVVVVVVVLWLLSLFFDFGSIGNIGTHRIGR